MRKFVILFILACFPFKQVEAQTWFRRIDSVLTHNYRKGDIDTTFIIRPHTKWTIKGRLNVSGAKIESEGQYDGSHFKSEMTADYKSTLSAGVTYLGFSLNAALNPPS